MNNCIICKRSLGNDEPKYTGITAVEDTLCVTVAAKSCKTYLHGACRTCFMNKLADILRKFEKTTPVEETGRTERQEPVTSSNAYDLQRGEQR